MTCLSWSQGTQGGALCVLQFPNSPDRAVLLCPLPLSILHTETKLISANCKADRVAPHPRPSCHTGLSASLTCVGHTTGPHPHALCQASAPTPTCSSIDCWHSQLPLLGSYLPGRPHSPPSRPQTESHRLAANFGRRGVGGGRGGQEGKGSLAPILPFPQPRDRN